MANCATPKLLAHVRGLLKSDGCQSAAAMRDHLEAAERSFAEPLPLFRTIGEFPPAGGPAHLPEYRFVADKPDVQALAIANCHNGQRKLTMSLLEFVARSLRKLKCTGQEVLLVYPGASGMASVIALTAFPGLKIVIYDPAENTVKLMPPFADKVIYTHESRPADIDMERRLVVFTGRAGWFRDAEVPYIRDHVFPMSGRRFLLFVSDIRAETGEENIVQDMLMQQRWAIDLAADAYMFKFRMPYADTPEQARSYRAAYTATSDAMQRSGKVAEMEPGQGLPYLEGDLYVQLYARPRTAELRLIGYPRRRGQSKAFHMAWHDTKRIEDAMATFNYVYRSNARFLHRNAAILTGKARVLPYEQAAELDILTMVALASGHRDRATVSGFLERVNADMDKIIADKASPTECALVTAIKTLRRHADEYSLQFVDECYNAMQHALPAKSRAFLYEGIKDMQRRHQRR